MQGTSQLAGDIPEETPKAAAVLIPLEPAHQVTDSL